MLTFSVTPLDVTLCMPVELVAQGWLICPCFRVLQFQLRNSLMFDELWSEINDSQGEIFDVIEYKEEWEKEEEFDVEKYINGDTDY